MSQRPATKQIDYINAGLPAGVCTFPRRQSPNGWGSGVSSVWCRTGGEALVNHRYIYIPYPSLRLQPAVRLEPPRWLVSWGGYSKHLWGSDSKAAGYCRPGGSFMSFISTWCLFCGMKQQECSPKNLNYVPNQHDFTFSIEHKRWCFTECLCCAFPYTNTITFPKK